MMLAHERARHRCHGYTIVTDARELTRRVFFFSHRDHLALHVQPLMALSCCGSVCCGRLYSAAVTLNSSWRRRVRAEAENRLNPWDWRHLFILVPSSSSSSSQPGARALMRKVFSRAVFTVNNRMTLINMEKSVNICSKSLLYAGRVTDMSKST